MKLYTKKVITRGDNEAYLVRYSIFSCKYFAIKVHNILASDDACLHNHPWAFITCILKGGYFEESMYNKFSDFRWHGVGSVLYRPANFSHRLEIRKPVWTFVITFKKVQDWGFFTPKGFVNWRNYVQNKEGRCE